MKIDITDIPNGQLIKSIEFKINFEEGKSSTVIEHSPKIEKSSDDSKSAKVSIPDEMLDTTF